MEEYGTSPDGGTGPVEREFVLMPLFRRIRDRFRRNSNASLFEEKLPEDTYLYYPDRISDHAAAEQSAQENTAVLHSEQFVRSEASQNESAPEPELGTIAHEYTASVESFAPEARDTEFEHAEVPSLLTYADSLPTPEQAEMEGATLERPLQLEPQSPLQEVHEGTAAAFSNATQPESASSFEERAVETPFQRSVVVPITGGRHEEEIPIPAESSSDNLQAANLQYLMQQNDLSERRASAKQPRITKRQVTVTVPQVNWQMFRPNWKILRPALAYGAVGFLMCLLLFVIPALRRPASSALPISAVQPQQSAVGTASRGYTLQTGMKGYTVNPAPQAESNAPVPAPRVKKPHAARRGPEPEVVVRHYQGPSPSTPKVVRASNGVKKYSDLD